MSMEEDKAEFARVASPMEVCVLLYAFGTHLNALVVFLHLIHMETYLTLCVPTHMQACQGCLYTPSATTCLSLLCR